MLSYIDKNLLPGEHILFRTKKHVIIFFFPIVLTLFSFYATHYLESQPILMKLSFAPWLITLIFWGYATLEYLFSDFAVTNRRVMLREGFFYRHANEMRLSAISKVNISQSLLGQMLNYGLVTINAFGAFDSYSLIADAYKFQQVVNEQLDKLSMQR